MAKKEIAVVDRTITEYQKKIKSLVEAFQGRDIKTEADKVEANEILSQLNREIDAAEEKKQEVLTPLNAARAAELARWKPFESYAKPAVVDLRNKLSDYQTAETEKADAEKAKIAARVGPGKGKFTLETASAKSAEVVVPEASVETESGSLSFISKPTLKITNTVHLINDIIKNHAGSFEKFVSYNEKNILAALQAGEKIAGVEIKIIQVPRNSR